MKRHKLFNDPVHGFITVGHPLLLKLIDHPWVQRLRHIKQMGMNDMVYPGALHTRFHHALGAMHLMNTALQHLKEKGVAVSEQEHLAANCAVLLHDVGHGPFSHALEETLLPGIHHEDMSALIIHHLAEELGDPLPLALQMVRGTYPRPFLNQLVSSQLDVDRMDYLKRDSFYTGVLEGSIGTSRILKMMDVRHERLVVEEKGIYSIENFLNARRLMYWQVYLHKAAVSADRLMVNTIERARQLTQRGQDLPGTPSFMQLLRQQPTLEDLMGDRPTLQAFLQLDDADVWACLKFWRQGPDKLLAELSERLLHRRLLKIQLANEPYDASHLQGLVNLVQEQLGYAAEEARLLVPHGQLTNEAYQARDKHILILRKNGAVEDIATAVDLPNVRAMSQEVVKHYVCWPKELSL